VLSQAYYFAQKIQKMRKKAKNNGQIIDDKTKNHAVKIHNYIEI